MKVAQLLSKTCMYAYVVNNLFAFLSVRQLVIGAFFKFGKFWKFPNNTIIFIF